MSEQIVIAETPEAQAPSEDLVTQLATKLREQQLANRDDGEQAGIDAGIEAAKELVREAMKTPKSGAVDAAIAAQDAEPVEGDQRVQAPYGAGGRTRPAALSDIRYRRLGKRGEHRSADSDVACQRWLIAMKDNNSVALAEIGAADTLARQRAGLPYERAPLAIGAVGANFGVSGGTGAQFVPLELSDYLQAVIYRNARLRNWSRNFEAGVGDNLRIGIQDGKPTTAFVQEGVAITPGEPTNSDGVKLDLQQIANLSDITDQLLLSTPFNVGDWLSTQVGEQMAEVEDLKMYQTGAGSASFEPAGLEASDTTTTGPNLPAYFVPAAAQTANFTVPGVIDLDLIIDMFFKLPENHRRNAIWSGPDTVAAILSKVVDSNGRPIFNFANNPAAVVGDSDAVGQVGTMMNRPYINMPGKEGVGEDANRLYLSAMDRTYAMLERGGIQAESSRDFKFDKRLTTFRFIRDVDGQPIGNRTLTLPFDYVYSGNLT